MGAAPVVGCLNTAIYTGQICCHADWRLIDVAVGRCAVGVLVTVSHHRAVGVLCSSSSRCSRSGSRFSSGPGVAVPGRLTSTSPAIRMLWRRCASTDVTCVSLQFLFLTLCRGGFTNPNCCRLFPNMAACVFACKWKATWTGRRDRVIAIFLSRTSLCRTVPQLDARRAQERWARRRLQGGLPKQNGWRFQLWW